MSTFVFGTEVFSFFGESVCSRDLFGTVDVPPVFFGKFL